MTVWNPRWKMNYPKKIVDKDKMLIKITDNSTFEVKSDVCL